MTLNNYGYVQPRTSEPEQELDRATRDVGARGWQASGLIATRIEDVARLVAVSAFIRWYPDSEVYVWSVHYPGASRVGEERSAVEAVRRADRALAEVLEVARAEVR